jgi:hypothetical protein
MLKTKLSNLPSQVYLILGYVKRSLNHGLQFKSCSIKNAAYSHAQTKSHKTKLKTVFLVGGGRGYPFRARPYHLPLQYLLRYLLGYLHCKISVQFYVLQTW